MTATTEKLAPLADELGVSVSALTALRITRNGSAWQIPERDASGKTIGVVRRFDNGDKKARSGSKRGLTFVHPFDSNAGASPENPILVVEGASDTAAGLDIGFGTVGRPSALGGLKYIAQLLRNKSVVVVGENDGGPGQLGAEKIASGLLGVAASVKVIFPPSGVKDLREWKSGPAGCDRDELLGIVGNTPELEPPDDKPVILDSGDPIATARELIRRRHEQGEVRLLMHYQGLFRRWDGTAYPVAADDGIRAELWQFMEQAEQETPEGPVPFRPNKSRVDNAADALRAVCHIPPAVTPPVWLSEDQGLEPAEELVACQDLLLHAPSGSTRPATPCFFNVSALPVAYEPDAPEPNEWHRFLLALWPEDPASIFTLQEWFGYSLTPDTRLQKILLVVGPKRSGKGTIARVLTGLLGPENICAPTLAGLSTNFGMSPLIDKNLAVVSDARLGRRTDQAAITERLLSISGEDAITIDRKYLSPWTGKLPTRFMVLTNELPRLADTSGALASRFIVLTLTRSFLGNEDHELTGRLLTELPGILNWAIVGHQSLRERGRFQQPESAADAIQQLEDLGSPIGAFIRDGCDVGPGLSCASGNLFDAWKGWCESQGRDWPGTKPNFARDLMAAMPGVRKARPRDEGENADKRIPTYEGIALKP